jgi:hypothetical protein
MRRGKLVPTGGDPLASDSENQARVPAVGQGSVVLSQGSDVLS